jgi:hypothetical protein
MPGFMIGGSGGVADLAGPDGKGEVKRKYRWVMSILPSAAGGVAGAASGILLDTDLLYLKSASRPNYSTDEIDQHHNQENIWHIGKTKWEPIELSFYDMEAAPNISSNIYNWLTKTVNDIAAATVQGPATYKQSCQLTMLDGGGVPTEVWALYHTWPKSVNWNELDYSSNEAAMVNVTLRYDRAVKLL